MLSSKNQKFSVTDVVINGDKKLARTLGNYFTEIENVSNNLIFEIKADKQKTVSSRTNIGATSEFTINLNFKLKVISENSNEVILEQNFSRAESFKTSRVHLDTLRRENKIVDNSIKDIAQQISKRLNVIFN